MARLGPIGNLVESREADEKFVELPRERRILLPAVVHGRQSTLIGYLSGTQWSALDPATGRVQGGPDRS